ncbi:hypothetical protein AALO_G00091530 [Alosa alosa]|uniref:C2H2-type domain-containing protein n=1 Tax=Alosa alosa TaxID=278164 RepID=A0AAV6GS75_9TELE|nr:hypothetical protein AALO_G00091530 [Alosa alosa]
MWSSGLALENFGWDHLWSVGNMDLGLSFSSGCNVTDTRQLDQLSVMVKEEDIKEEEYGHMISCPDEDEKPFAELHCKTETDVTESKVTYNETQQTTAEIEVKIEDDKQEHDYLLGSVSEYPDAAQQKIHGQNDELNLQLKGTLHHCTVCRRSFTALRELKKHQQTHSVSSHNLPWSFWYLCDRSGSLASELRRSWHIHTLPQMLLFVFPMPGQKRMSRA